MAVLSPELLEQIEQAAGRLLAGGLVAYPSETVWGLAVHPAHPGALDRLYRAKGRDFDKAMQVSCADPEGALALAAPDPALAALAAFWPGPLTVVTPAASDCPAILAPGGRVGLRVPDHPVALALIRRAGGRLLTTSCNRSGEPAALTRAQAQATALADLTLPDAGVEPQGQASTVIEWPSGTVLRAGSVAPNTVLEAMRSHQGAR